MLNNNNGSNLLGAILMGLLVGVLLLFLVVRYYILPGVEVLRMHSRLLQERIVVFEEEINKLLNKE